MKIHPFKKWLIETGRTQAWVARQLGFSRQYLNQILLGNRNPSVKLTDRLSEISGGAVTVDDIMLYLKRNRHH